MSKVALLVMAIFSTLFSTAALAQEKVVAVHGAGSDSCGKYRLGYEEYRRLGGGTGGKINYSEAVGQFLQEQAWMEGFLDARTGFTSERHHSYDQATLVTWVYDFCQKRPLSSVVSASLAMAEELRNRSK